MLAQFPLSGASDVTAAVKRRPAHFRNGVARRRQIVIQYLFKLKQVLEENFEDMLVSFHGKREDVANRARDPAGIENVESGVRHPDLMQGYNLEDVASGIDEFMIRQPLGVVAAISPFNFPVMIPFCSCLTP